MYKVAKKLIHEGKVYRPGEMIDLSKTEAADYLKRKLVNKLTKEEGEQFSAAPESVNDPSEGEESSQE